MSKNMKKKPLVLGHRGYEQKSPENTLESFSQAFAYGADGIECDIQKTADGRYIVFHDDELSRITGYKGFVRDMTLAEIRKLDAGSGTRIPDIESFLDSLPAGREINIELKEETITPADFDAIHGALAARGLKENILISSFRYDLLPAYKKAGYRTGMLFEFFHALPVFSILRYMPCSVNIPIRVFSGRLRFPAKLFLLVVKLLGIKTVYWTVNTVEQYNSIKDNAVAIITDNIELMVSLRGMDEHAQ